MGKNFLDWELAKFKVNLKPESSIKVVWYTWRRELGGMKSVNAMETTTKSSFENL